MLEARQLRISYSAPEDRLVIFAVGKTDKKVMLLLTRRLAGAFLNGLGTALRRFKTNMAVIPEEFRDNIVLMEHQEAIAADLPQKASQTTIRDCGGTWLSGAVLVTEIQLTTHASYFIAVFQHGKTAMLSLRLSRQDAHRLLDALKRHAEQASWSLVITESWLSAGQTSWTIN